MPRGGLLAAADKPESGTRSGHKDPAVRKLLKIAAIRVTCARCDDHGGVAPRYWGDDAARHLQAQRASSVMMGIEVLAGHHPHSRVGAAAVRGSLGYLPLALAQAAAGMLDWGRLHGGRSLIEVDTYTPDQVRANLREAGTCGKAWPRWLSATDVCIYVGN